MTSQETSDSQSQTLTELYDKAQKLYNDIESSTLDSNSEELQKLVEECCCRFEHLTVLVSEVSLFSPNESIAELSTSSLKFLLLPARLGELTLKRTSLLTSGKTLQHPESSGGASNQNTESKIVPDRLTLLRLANVYFRDFITRCKQYEITTVEITPVDSNHDDERPSQPKANGGRPTPQQLQAMGREREQKILRYKEKKRLEEKLASLTQATDEEDLREYYISSVMLAVHGSVDQLDSIKMERDMLQHMAKCRPEDNKQQEKDRAAQPQPLQPFLITRDAVQKKIYGMGYPSLPVMSVDEFYEKRVRDGIWTAGGGPGDNANIPEPGQVPEDEHSSDDEESDRTRERLQARDQYRDMHRTGWGNTYNRS